jgi:peptidyl-dipeptidase Dcp
MTATDNPLLAEWPAPYEVPPFADIRLEHYVPAIEAAFVAHLAEIAAIAQNAAEPTFQNVIEPLERSGWLYLRVASAFLNLADVQSTEAIQAIERDVSPRIAAHGHAIATDPGLFAQISAIYEQRDSLGLSREQLRVLEEHYKSRVRAGAHLDEAGRARMAEIAGRQAELATRFSQNVLADENSYLLLLDEGDLTGLPDFLIAAAAETAKERGHAGKYGITLSRSSIVPFLQFSGRRDLREQAFKAWIARGAGGGETDNRANIAEMLRLRAEKARLLGFATYADYGLDNTMAARPSAVRELLEAVWKPARAQAMAESAGLSAAAAAEGENFALAPWDWRYYAEKVRKAKHNLDEAEIKPYFELDRMIEAAFDTAHRLFGVTVKPRTDLPLYHPDARAWEVFGHDGQPLGLFIGDYFARANKRGGGWMSTYRGQHKLDGNVRPVVVNVLNFAKGAPGEPSLLSMDDARTLFHEFGHGLHGLLSDVTYRSISCTSVKQDFVELPSQLYEHWLLTPEVMGRFALHTVTGEPMPQALMEKLLAARKFDQGFSTVEYVASAIIDMDLHEQAGAEADIDIDAAEAEVLARIGMPDAIVLRHRPTQFLHLFASSSGYAAGYYSYLWSEVMDADAFSAFQETGDVFDPSTAARLYRYIYSSGGSMDPAEAYRAFRGRMPEIAALLEKRGLSQPAA